MALARYDEGGRQPSQNYQEVEQMPVGRAMARVCGYMAIAVGVTAAVAIGIASLMYYVIFGQRTLDQVVEAFKSGTFDAAITGYLVVFGVSAVVVLIMSFVMPFAMRSTKRSAWPAFIIYAIFMGAMLSCLVLMCDIATLGQALGISLGAFIIMFLIGRFSKADLNPLGLVAIGLLFVVLMVGAFTGLFFWLNPSGFRWMNLVINIIVCGLMMIVTAVDAYNIKKLLERGQCNNNVLLFSAYCLYCDFITLLIRVIIILLSSKSK